MEILECECGFNIADEPEMGLVIFYEHRKNCEIWQHILNKVLKEK